MSFWSEVDWVSVGVSVPIGLFGGVLGAVVAAKWIGEGTAAGNRRWAAKDKIRGVVNGYIQLIQKNRNSVKRELANYRPTEIAGYFPARVQQVIAGILTESQHLRSGHRDRIEEVLVKVFGEANVAAALSERLPLNEESSSQDMDAQLRAAAGKSPVLGGMLADMGNPELNDQGRLDKACTAIVNELRGLTKWIKS